MARPIPQNPQDKEQYSGLFMGVPVVLEYDDASGAFKLVVAQEYAVNFMVSGIVSLEAGDIEIGAVEIKDHTTDDRAHVDTSNLLHVCVASGTFLALGLIFSEYIEDTPHVSGDIGQFILAVRNDAHGSMVNADGDYAPFQVNEYGYLKVWTSGSFVDTELSAPVALGDVLANPTAGGVGAYLLSYHDPAGIWSRARAAILGADGVIVANQSPTLGVASWLFGLDSSGTFSRLRLAETSDVYAHTPFSLEVAALAMGYYPASGTWSRLRVDSNDYLEVTLGTRLSHTLDSVQLGDGTDLVGVTPDGCLQVQVCTGSVNALADTELPDAVVLADSLGAALTAPYLGAIGYGYHVSDSVFRRFMLDDYGEGGTNPNNMLVVKAFMQAAEQGGASSYNLEMFRPDGDWEQWEGITSHLKVAGPIYGYDEVAEGFDRLRSEGASGSYALRTAMWAWNGATMDRVRLRTDVAGMDAPIEVWTTGSFTVADTEMPAAVALSDALANPTAPAVGAYGLAYNEEDVDWERLRSEGISGSYSLRVSLYAQAGDGFVPLQLDANNYLITADSKIGTPTQWDDDPALTQPTVGYLGALLAGYDTATGKWISIERFGVSDNLTPSNVLGVGAIGYVFDGTNHDRVRSFDTTSDSQAGLAGGHQAVAAIGFVFDGTNFDRARSIDTSADAIAGAAQGHQGVASLGYAYDDVDGEWDRLRNEGASGTFALRTSMWAMAPAGYAPVAMDASGNLMVALGVNLDALSDEVTAHVTGTVNITNEAFNELASGTVVGLGGQTKGIQREIINITGSAGEYMLLTGSAGQRIKVMEVMLIASSDTEVIFKSSWTGSWKTGPLGLPSDGDGFFCGAPPTPDQFHFETDVGHILVLELIGGARIGGWINYYEEA